MKQTYLPYIDGLRAVAVLAVIIFHLNANWLPGGFVGVDMFFVISGFIVSYSIGDRKYTSFASYLTDFYSRRIKRIFPALLFVVLTTAFFTALFIPNSWLSQVNYSTGLFALFGLSNFILVQNNRDYFGATTEFNPYTHTWSLGIEEQFYVLFPFLFYGWVNLANKSKKKNTFILFSIVFIVSLIVSYILSSQQPLKAYFLPYSRLWELALGALCYQAIFYLSLKEKPSWIEKYKTIFSIIATCLIGYGLIFTSTSHFPMPGAVVVTTGTALLILSLYFQSHTHWLPSFLCIRPLNTIGKISYSLYLWHWPIFVLFRWTYGLENVFTIMTAVTITFFMAAISYAFVEKPIRINSFIRSIPNLLIISAGLVSIGFSYYLYQYINQKTDAISQSTVVKNNRLWYPVSLTSDYQSIEPFFSTCPSTGTEHIVNHIPSYQITPSCQLGQYEMHELYAIGDSHTLAYSTLFFELAARTSSKVNIYPNAGCPFIRLDETDSYVSGISSENNQTCLNQNNKIFDLLKQQMQAGDVLFLSSLSIPRLSDQWAYFGWNETFFTKEAQLTRQKLVKEAIELLRPLSHKGVKIVFEAPKPIFPAPPYRCSDWFNQNNPICANGLSVEKSALAPYREPLIQSMKNIQAALDEVYIWDPMPLLCPNETCEAIQDNNVLFFDGDHISSVGSQRLSPDFAQFIEPLLQSNQKIARYVDLTEPIFFNAQKLGNALLMTKGLSHAEAWGRWSDANLYPEVELSFASELPQQFNLELEIHGHGLNRGEQADLYIGTQHYRFKIPKYTDSVKLSIYNKENTSILRIVPPKPTVSNAQDTRQLGIGLISMRISPIP